MSILIKALNHTYLQGTPFEEQVLFDLHLQLEAGGFYGLTGPTQAGKSTLIKYFNGLYHPPEEGQVKVLGIDTGGKDAPLEEIRRRVGLLFQHPEDQLFQETAAEDVAFGPVRLGWGSDKIKEKLREVFAAVELDWELYKDREIHALSGGEKKRLALAGVLVTEPELLVLDEPLSGLDPGGRKKVLKIINDLKEKEGLTVILVSTALDEVLPLLDRVLVLDQGRIKLEGSPEEVFSGEGLSELNRLGLRLPRLVALMASLRERGLEVRLNSLSLAEAEKEIWQALNLDQKRGGVSDGAGG